MTNTQPSYWAIKAGEGSTAHDFNGIALACSRSCAKMCRLYLYKDSEKAQGDCHDNGDTPVEVTITIKEVKDDLHTQSIRRNRGGPG